MKKQNKDVLYISYDGMTDALGQSQVIPYLVGLSSLGYRFSLLSFEKSERFKERKVEIQELLERNNIEWFPLPYTKRPPVLSTLIDLWKMRNKAFSLHKKKGFQIVHCRSYISSIVGLSLKLSFKESIKFLFDMRGFWIEERLDGKIWNLSNPLYLLIYKFFKSKENSFFQESDQIIILTERGKEHLLQQKQLNSKKIGVVPTCVNFQKFSLLSRDENQRLKNKLRIAGEKKVFLYSGALGGSYDPAIILKAYSAFRSYFKSTHLLILSKDFSEFQKTLNLVSYGISSDELSFVQAPFSEVHKYLNISDAGFVFYTEGWSNIGRSPTKMGEYLACGLPVIVYGDVGDVSRLKEYLQLYVVSELSDEEMRTVFSKIEKGKERLTIRNDAAEYYSLEGGVNFYSSIYQNME